jgi:hypothetical protein
MANLMYEAWFGWPCLRLGFELSLPMEPELDLCVQKSNNECDKDSGWRCPHRRPTIDGVSRYSGGMSVFTGHIYECM